jgi:hypothetical protein
VRLPFEIRNKTVNFTPPDEFVEMLNGLTEGGKGETDGDMPAL